MRSGVLNIDKPAGITSHDVVKQVRRLSGVQRVGHAGTLDPLATGVLVLCLGQATRLVEYVTGQPKQYITTIRLGQVTTTYDAEGEIVKEQPVSVTRADIVEQLPLFQGVIEQLPPMYSAVRHQGQRLYELARQGETVQRKPRQVTIYELALVSFDLPEVTLHVQCGAGTYIRSLAHDLGEALGCGAYVKSLRRTGVGCFQVRDAVSLTALTSENLFDSVEPMGKAVQHLPAIQLSPSQIDEIRHGRRIARRPDDPAVKLVQAIDHSGALLAILTTKDEMWQPKKVLI